MTENPITFTRCAAIEDDYYMFSSTLDGMEEPSDFSRIFYYDEQSAEIKWRHSDIQDCTTSSLCIVKTALGHPRKYAVLSKNAGIFYYWPGGQKTEKIADAGLDRDAPVYGYLNALKEVDGHLYACGAGGQIYHRHAGEWVDIAGDLRKSTPVVKPDLAMNSIVIGDNLSDIDGFSSTDLYASGREGIYHYDGSSWQECRMSTDEIMTGLLCSPDGIVWACGFNGAIMRGNAETGFNDVSHYDDNMILTRMVFFGERIYFASNEGLFFIEHGKEKPALQKVAEVAECDDISACGDTLLCIGPKKISILRGGTWRELKHPDLQSA